ncbi:Ail/Lom family outer membrane beta-barrel protein [Budviciaceae bacterium BWR-B9]|uniref:Ail/Lom family outer membrane beta-barrel protein n=1 Tax=Limnobaculum allomyrinae TaxID=2791986 RepID=A0ABS1IMM8_9GAMM|nr:MULTISPECIES: Ail/Lom family outer membrane beta-barrel protein [Limnobaculum]MBK5142924.1 Ail/Lom family outer membrane beta-barrel protein [Limnobaculum allomyrinae]MBV7690189.1 Ail/Lom family outer membrane beta-barrel protein [Limnobaculum sp. M2-1]
MKKVLLGCLVVCSLVSTSTVLADTQTISAGYAQSKVQDYKNINGFNLQYRYEWDSPVSLLTSFTYMSGSDSNSYNDSWGDHYKNSLDVKYYSLLVGPAYRLNSYVSLYGAVGASYTKSDGSYEWYNSVGADEDDGHLKGSLSNNSTEFAYGAGVIINPTDYLSFNVGYEGSKLDLMGSHSINGFNVGIGYKF